MLGILSLVLCWIGFILGIVAIALGASARKDINASNGAVGGGGMATAGLVTGIIGTVLWGGWIVVVVLSGASAGY